MTTIRRQIGERMQLSHRTSPHVLTVMEADLACVTAHRSTNKQAFAADGVNLTYTAYLIAAIAAGLKAQPLVNSSWTDQGILIHSEINIGMATSLGADGLIVPVLSTLTNYPYWVSPGQLTIWQTGRAQRNCAPKKFVMAPLP